MMDRRNFLRTILAAAAAAPLGLVLPADQAEAQPWGGPGGPPPPPGGRPPAGTRPPPPPPRWEPTPPPRRGYVWLPGYWGWNPRRGYVWNPGRWAPARMGQRYVGPSWVFRGGQWQFVPGRWVHW